MNVSKNDIEFYIKREFSDFLEKMTDDEINEITHWCDALIRQRQKIENDIIRNIEIALSEAKDKIKELKKEQKNYKTDKKKNQIAEEIQRLERLEV